jgi:hypothetical protein
MHSFLAILLSAGVAIIIATPMFQHELFEFE